MNVSRSIVLALVLVGLCACVAINSHQRGPNCLGPVCIVQGESIWKDAGSFFEKYGVGVERRGKFPAYWYNENGTYVYIDRYHGENKPIDTIVVSKYPYYSEHSLPPKESFGPLTTKKGVGLGASYDQVVAAYGKPDHLYTYTEEVKGQVPETWHLVNPKDIIIVRYENSFGEDFHGPWSLFFFENDVLIAIELSNAL